MKFESPIANIIYDLQELIAANLPEIRWTDQYLGQDQTDLRPMLAYPAVLIEAEQTEYSELGNLSQFANSTISLRLITDNFSSSAQAAPESSRLKALEYYDLEDRLVALIHGWRPQERYCQKLIRTADRSENRNDIGLRIRTITFTTAFAAEYRQ